MTIKYLALALTATSLSLSACGEGEKQYGAWFGEMQLCSDTVANFRRTTDRQTGLPALRIRFKAEAARELSRMSAIYVGKTLPLVVNGVEVFAPTLAEPLTQGQVWVTVPREDQLIDAAAYMERPCRFRAAAKIG